MKLRVTCVLLLLLSASFVFAGPNRWSTSGPWGGRVADLVADPTNPAVLYATAFWSGLYKSVDRGSTWYRIFYGDGVSSVALDPSGNVVMLTFSGLFRSTDGGSTWTQLYTPPDYPGYVRLDPKQPSTLYLWNPLRRSTDGGATWTNITAGLETPEVKQFLIDPVDSANLYVIAESTSGNANRVYHSANRGTTWDLLTVPEPDFTGLGIDPAHPSTIYVGGQNVILKSTNRGASWTKLTTGLAGGYVYAIAVDPLNPAVLYAGGGLSSGWIESMNGFIYKSTNGGANWTPLAPKINGTFVMQLFVDAAASSTLFAATTGRGVMRSGNGGTNWAEINRGLAAREIFSITVDPSDGKVAYACSGASVARTADGGRTWSDLAVQAMAVGVHPQDPRILYAASLNGVSRSTDSGAHWTTLNDSTPFAGAKDVVIDPSNPSVIYISGYFGIAKSTNGGTTWTPIESGLTPSLRVFDFAMDPRNASVLYVAYEDGLYRSLSGGAGWSRVPGTPPKASAVAFDGRGGIYAACGNEGLYKSSNDGSTWTRVAPSEVAGAYSVVVDRAHPDTIYLDTLRSDDGGATWWRMSAGLRPLFLTDLAIDRSGRYLYAGQYENSVGTLHPTPITLPAAASLQGIGAHFRSDVVVLHTGAFAGDLPVTATYRCFSGACGNAVQKFTLKPGEARRFPDIVESLFGAPGTGGAIEFTAPSHFVVTSRLYTPGAHGTYGQFIPGLPDDEAFAGAATPSLSYSTSTTGGFRTNTGVFNASDTAQTATFSIYDDAGVLAGEVQRQLAPRQALQVNNVFAAAGVTRNLDRAYCVVRGSAAAPLFAYSSVVDNQSLDPTFVRGCNDDEGITGRTILPAAASLHGINSFFHSDVAVLNVSRTERAEVTATYRCLGGSCLPVTKTFTVLPRQAMVFDDMVGTFFNAPETGGAIEFTTGGRIAVTSRLYTPSKPAPTFGQFVHGMPIDMGFERSVLTGLSQGSGFRSNVGAYNASDLPQIITFEVRAGNGQILGQTTRLVAARQPVQINNIFGAAGITDAYANAYCVVSGSLNAPLFAYASVLDDISNDPVFVYGEWME